MQDGRDQWAGPTIACDPFDILSGHILQKAFIFSLLDLERDDVVECKIFGCSRRAQARNLETPKRGLFSRGTRALTPPPSKQHLPVLCLMGDHAGHSRSTATGRR